MKEYETNMDKLEFLALYLKCINYKTGIPNYILVNVCKKLTNDCNNILTKITDFQVDITFEGNLEIYTTEGEIKIPAEMSSGF